MALLDHPNPRAIGRGFGRRIGVPGLGVLAAGLVAAAALLPVAQTSNATATGHAIRALESRRADIQASIRATQSEVATLGALDRVDREARERLGMAPADRFMYVTVPRPAPVAGMPARYLNEEAPAAATPAAMPWWKAALNRLPLP